MLRMAQTYNTKAWDMEEFSSIVWLRCPSKAAGSARVDCPRPRWSHRFLSALIDLAGVVLTREFSHRVYHCRHVIRVDARGNAMTQVKDMARTLAIAL